MAYDPWVITPQKKRPGGGNVQIPMPDVPTGAGDAPPAPGKGGASFDFASNPYYQQALAAVNAGGAADAANTRAAIQQALVAFGFVPGGFKDKLGALDSITRALIQKNTDTGISGYARLLEGREEGIKDIVRRLQSKGLRRSGAKGSLLKKNQLGYDRNFADAVSNLLSGVGGMYGQYAQNEQNRQMQLADAMRWVYQNYYTPPATSGGGKGNFVPNSGWGTGQAWDVPLTPRENYAGGIGGRTWVV